MYIVSRVKENGGIIVAINNQISEKLLETGFHYAQSHQNDPLGCAVVCAVLTEIRDAKLIENAAKMGKYFVEKLHNLSGNTRYISEIRGRSLMIAIELDQHVPIENIHRGLFEKGWIVGLNIPNLVKLIFSSKRCHRFSILKVL